MHPLYLHREAIVRTPCPTWLIASDTQGARLRAEIAHNQQEFVRFTRNFERIKLVDFVSIRFHTQILMNTSYKRFIVILDIMSQFLNYIASVLTGNSAAKLPEQSSKNDSANFGTRLYKTASEFTSPLFHLDASLITVYKYIGVITFVTHFTMITWPKLQQDSLDLSEPHFWQPLILSAIPLLVYLGSVAGMIELNKQREDDADVQVANDDVNQFIQSLKIVIVVMSICQLSAIFSERLLWAVVMIVSIQSKGMESCMYPTIDTNQFLNSPPIRCPFGAYN